MANNPKGKLLIPLRSRKKTSDFLLYADDANFAYSDISEVLHTLRTYKETAEHGNFIIRWGKVFILLTNKDKTNRKNKLLNSRNLSATSNTKQNPKYLDISWILQITSITQ